MRGSQVVYAAASLVALYRFLCGESHVVWTPIREPGPAVTGGRQ